MFKIEIATLFPSIFVEATKQSILKRAIEKKLVKINTYNIRDYTKNKHKKVDDYPYGGGKGMLMMADPIYCCCEEIMKKDKKIKVIYLSPKGKVLKQEKIEKLAKENSSILLICGHYEGIDQRLIDLIVDEEISIGDYVLTGGEMAALVLVDALIRMIPGVLSDSECYEKESHYDGLLEYPQYTRTREWKGQKVPDVLLSGDHKKIEEWRKIKSIEITKINRKDMWKRYEEREKND